MQTKLFELRDAGTFVPVLCTMMESDQDQEAWLLRRAGYQAGGCLVMMTGLVNHPDKASYSPYDWGDNRTRKIAHQYITDHWDKLASGAVIDVEFILGIRAQPKKSEREPSE